jgi:hypothetical protein
MAGIQFPLGPSSGQIFTTGAYSWIWTGSSWDSYGSTSGSGSIGATGATGVTGGNGIDGANSRRWTGLNGSLAPTAPGQITLRISTVGGVTTVPSAVTIVRLNELDEDSANLDPWLSALDTYIGTGTGYLQLTDAVDNSIFGIYSMSNVTKTSNYYTITVVYVAGNGTFNALNSMVVSWVLFGLAGSTGLTGPTGSTGATGTGSLYDQYEIESSGGATFIGSTGSNNIIIDPTSGIPISILTIQLPEIPVDGTSIVVSFGGVNIASGPVVYNLIWDPAYVLAGHGANQAEAGDGYLLVYDGTWANKWRIY